MGDGPESPAVRTVCPYCGVGCGVLARAERAEGAEGGEGPKAGEAGGRGEIAGDPEHPANAGRLCVKGAMLGETLDLDGRLLHPEIEGRRASWREAIDRVAGAFATAIREHGPDSVALYVSGQLLTEDYYVANKLMKGFVGSANIDTNSRLCMASSVAGHKRAFGADVVPGVYEDFDAADLIVLVGSNLAWCHPVLFQRLVAAKRARPGLRVVNVDPRRTASSELADVHLAVAPGADVALFNGLLSWLEATGRRDGVSVAAHACGVAHALGGAGPLYPAGAAAATGLSPEELSGFYALWAGAERVVTIYSQGVNQWSTGTDKVNAILNCHLFTGRIGKPGCGPFSVTGQPNAMGGREVGGLANMLAAHMAIESADDRDRVQRFWSAPRIAERQGLKAVDMFDALGDGRIKALWVMATNPAVSLPDADTVAKAIRNARGLVVVSDIMRRTDTTELANVLLPATGWGEKDGSVTNSERRISRQRAFLAAPGEARHDWRIICDVARAIGRGLGESWDAAFAFPNAAAIFREHARLSGFENDGSRAFDISGLAEISDGAYDAMTPTRWPLRANGDRPERFFGNGGFYTPDRKARLAPVAPRETGHALDDAYPLILNTGRVRDHWHTMTRTAKSPRLSRHIAEPYLEIRPDDAAALGLCDADLVRVVSRHGAVVARARLSDRQRPGSVFAPMHWTAQNSNRGRVDALVRPLTDPISGQPESKRTPVRVERLAAVWHGFALTRSAARPDCAYWAAARTRRGWRLELAGEAALADVDAFARDLLGGDGEVLSYADAARDAYRIALFNGDRLDGALFLGPAPMALARDWLANAFDGAEDAADLRRRFLAGRAGAGLPDAGPTVCVCENVGARVVEQAIAAGAGSVDAIGAACRAGTNCGSCRADLAEMLRAAQPAVAAE